MARFAQPVVTIWVKVEPVENKANPPVRGNRGHEAAALPRIQLNADKDTAHFFRSDASSTG